MRYGQMTDTGSQCFLKDRNFQVIFLFEDIEELIPYETTSWFKKHELVKVCLKDNILNFTMSEINTVHC
jgi:hypothetical protein